jgi:predicted transcriptional regulator
MLRIARSAGVLLCLSIAIWALPGCDENKPSAQSSGDDAPRPEAAPEKTAATEPSAYKLSGPFTHDNLAIYLVHGAERMPGKMYLTLEEALEQKKVVVHETGNVSELSIENVSDTDEVYVQSGDIVKGGQQDRVIACDLIVPKKSGKMPIASFCVESGRWSQRQQEEVKQFDSSKEQFASRRGKLAAKMALCVKDDQSQQAQQEAAQSALRTQNRSQMRDTFGISNNSTIGQHAVWKEVAISQKNLSTNAGVNVQAAESASSMQLTLENKAVQDASEAYIKQLSKITDGKDDVIGFVFAINGKLNNADTYASQALFKKLWPKLLKASAVEAFAEKEKDKKFDAPKTDAVQKWLADARQGEKVEKDVSKRVRMVARKAEKQKTYLFETHDSAVKGAGAAPIHENWVADE